MVSNEIILIGFSTNVKSKKTGILGRKKRVFQCSFLEELGAAASGKEKGKITTKETCDLVFLWHFYTLCHDDSLRSKIASLQVFCNKGYHVIVTAE